MFNQFLERCLHGFTLIRSHAEHVSRPFAASSEFFHVVAVTQPAPLQPLQPLTPHPSHHGQME
jgi:hypothetical protein